MKTVKIWFLGFWKSFDPSNNFITNILSQKYKVVITNEPEYLFFTRYDSEIYKYDCIRIFYTPENLVPDFNLCDYAIGYHEIDFGDRYFRYPLYLIHDYNYYPGDNYELDYKRMISKSDFTIKDLTIKKNFCGMVVSRGGCEVRDAFFEELSKYKTVLSGGKWKNNIGQRVDDKHAFLSSCKFSIAFENSSTPGYTTEKIMQAFAAKTIPLYYGNPNVGQEFNESSFVNIMKYETFHDAIEKIIEIDENDDLYLKMMRTTPVIETKINEIKKS